MAPISMACVASQSRWDVIRCSSDIMTRMICARLGIMCVTPISFSTASTNPRLFVAAAT